MGFTFTEVIPLHGRSSSSAAILNCEAETLVCCVNSGSAHFAVIHPFNFLLELLEAAMPSAEARSASSLHSGEDTAGETNAQVGREQ